MTGIYDQNPMPQKVDIKCPECSMRALFEFGEAVSIALKKDIPFFEKSDLFECCQFTDSSGYKWHGAVYFANLHGGSTKAIHGLPDGYQPEDWDHASYFTMNQGGISGAVSCRHCHKNRSHILKWPDEAFFKIQLKGQELWAYNQESAIELRDYIASQNRDIKNQKWGNFLRHIPTNFKTKNMRENVVKKLNKILDC